MTDKLTKYIRQNLAKGYPADQIKKTLLQSGYPEQTIDKELVVIDQTSTTPNQTQNIQTKTTTKPTSQTTSAPPKIKEPTPEEVKDEPYFIRLTSILFHPLKHLDKYKDEKGMKTPLRFLILTILIAYSIDAIFNILKDGNILKAVLTFIIALIIFLILGFIIVGVFHFWIRVVGGKQKFYQTFKAIAYPEALAIPSTFFIGLENFVPLIRLIPIVLGIWELILIESCLKAYTGLGTGRLVGAIALVIVSIVGVIILIVTLIGPSSLTLFATNARAIV